MKECTWPAFRRRDPRKFKRYSSAERAPSWPHQGCGLPNWRPPNEVERFIPNSAVYHDSCNLRARWWMHRQADTVWMHRQTGTHGHVDMCLPSPSPSLSTHTHTHTHTNTQTCARARALLTDKLTGRGGALIPSLPLFFLRRPPLAQSCAAPNSLSTRGRGTVPSSTAWSLGE